MSRPRKEVSLPIKDTPKYDPDAEILSLTLTIPSWISSMERACAMTDFAQTTESARYNLLWKLISLNAEITVVQRILREVNRSGK